MTIQVAVMNGYAVALASDRHVFRGNDVRASGQEIKLLRLRGAAPAAMMLSGPFAVFGMPAARLALTLERALAAVSADAGPEQRAQAVLTALEAAVPGPGEPAPLATAMAARGTPAAAPSDLFITVGLVCPATGVPALVSVRASPVAENRLALVSRLDSEYEVAWCAGRTVVVAQGSGRATLEALVDGMADEHWGTLDAAARGLLQSGMAARWDRAHARLGLASPRELAGVATGLVRGAEVVGFLTRDSEATIADVDCLLLTPREVAATSLSAGPALALQ